jgi:GntR family transcriptional regulator, transcriptional repressor for pyruvate dehydrogenase complex
LRWPSSASTSSAMGCAMRSIHEAAGRGEVDAVALSRVSRPSVHDEVLEALKRFIAESGLREGERLPGESALAARLGVGRPAVREALRALEAVGAVTTRKGVGRFIGRFDPDSYVRNFTTESLLRGFSERELMETRCLLEIVAIPEAVDRLSDTDLGEISRLQEAMRQRVEAGETYAAEDFGMHRAIMRHVDNRLLAAMLDAVYALTEVRLAETGSSHAAIQPERSRIDLAEHQALTDAVLAHDGRLAQRRLIAHFETTAQRLGFAPSWRALRNDGRIQ